MRSTVTGLLVLAFVGMFTIPQVMAVRENNDAGAFPEGIEAGVAVKVPPQVVQYPIGLREEFLAAIDAGNAPAIPGPDGHDLRLDVEEFTIFAPGGNRWYIIGESREDILDSGIINERFFRGKVAGVEPSAVVVTVGDFGLYASVKIDGWSANLIPIELGKEGALGPIAGTPSDWAQEVAWTAVDESSRLVPPLGPVPQPSGVAAAAWKTSKIAADAELRFRNAHGDWQSRITSAFAYHDGLWSDVETDLQLYGVYGVQNILTSSACTPADYENWLNSHLITGVDAYQLWVGIDLDGGCHGVARTGSWRANPNAASLLEGIDVNCCDAYNPADQNERGSLSAHELGHVHGANDITECAGFWTCNIMLSPCFNYDLYGLWFMEESKTKIRTHMNQYP